MGPHGFAMIWTMFGYEGDSEAMMRHRLRQGNLMGPAGLLGLEDNEAMKFVQDGIRKSREGAAVIELGGKAEGSATTLISEVGDPRALPPLARGHGGVMLAGLRQGRARCRDGARAALRDRGIPRRLLRGARRGPHRRLAGLLHRGRALSHHRARKCRGRSFPSASSIARAGACCATARSPSPRPRCSRRAICSIT